MISNSIALQSTITCPRCGHAKEETMPTNACMFFYVCEGCGSRLRPNPGDCCVFCSYGTVRCPPIQAGSGSSPDVMSSRLRMVLFYGLPGVAIYLTGNYGDRDVAAILWPVAFLVMGVACIANARRCRRVHCFFTGPLFLLASALSAAHGWHVIDLGPRAWELIGFGTFALALVLYYAPEAVWGKYFRRSA